MGASDVRDAQDTQIIFVAEILQFRQRSVTAQVFASPKKRTKTLLFVLFNLFYLICFV